MNFLETFTAKAISGSGRGNAIGIPTINLTIDPKSIKELSGMYACKVQLNTSAKWQVAVCHIGLRPTFNDTASCEIHIIDQEIKEVIDCVTVSLVAKIRNVQKFSSAEDLVSQIKLDILKTKQLLQCS